MICQKSEQWWLKGATVRKSIMMEFLIFCVVTFCFCILRVVSMVSCLVCIWPIAVYLPSPIESWAWTSFVLLLIKRIVLSPVLNVFAGIWNSNPILPYSSGTKSSPNEYVVTLIICAEPPPERP